MNKKCTNCHTIILWDCDVDRIKIIAQSLNNVLDRHNIIATVQVNCEPPILTRYQLWQKCPALQLDDRDFWNYGTYEVIEEKALEELILHLIEKKQIIHFKNKQGL